MSDATQCGAGAAVTDADADAAAKQQPSILLLTATEPNHATSLESASCNGQQVPESTCIGSGRTLQAHCCSYNANASLDGVQGTAL